MLNWYLNNVKRVWEKCITYILKCKMCIGKSRHKIISCQKNTNHVIKNVNRVKNVSEVYQKYWMCIEKS